MVISHIHNVKKTNTPTRGVFVEKVWSSTAGTGYNLVMKRSSTT
jgi:hypothetical protein